MLKVNISLKCVTSNITTYSSTRIIVKGTWKENFLYDKKGYVGEFDKKIKRICKF